MVAKMFINKGKEKEPKIYHCCLKENSSFIRHVLGTKKQTLDVSLQNM